MHPEYFLYPPIPIAVDAVTLLSQVVTQCYCQERFVIDEETWPPYDLGSFIPLTLVYHHKMKQVDPMPCLIQTGSSQFESNCYSESHSKKPLHRGIVTNELTEILIPLEQAKDPQFILIEGAPGIGKSVLLKEIAYRWSNKKLLKSFKVVLLVHLRDPNMQKASSVEALLQLFCNRSTHVASACSNYFIQNNGKNLLFLFDGFDEYPDELQKHGLIADLLGRRLLAESGLVVSSRSHVTVYLRQRATVRVDILGFTETEQRHFIKKALHNKQVCSSKLTEYLKNHFTISNLCMVPFNMAILLFLYEGEISLPDNPAELYSHFICLTVCQHIIRYHHHCLDNTITDLMSIPSPFDKKFLNLSKLAFKALNIQKLVFTFDEIKSLCPDITDGPVDINGLGLLQVVQHFGLTGKTMTFNFLHLSIQEFLAAHYITSLPAKDELEVLKENFWTKSYSNMFANYLLFTKGQQPSFKKFIKPSLKQRLKGLVAGEQVAISNQFLIDPLKCFCMFQCYFEADKEICRSIENAQIFNGKIVSLPCAKLLTTDIEFLAFFLTHSSHNVWNRVNIIGCYIQDHGIQILHYVLMNFKYDVTITTLWLGYNGLTQSSSTAISNITLGCRVKELVIDNNESIGENDQLYSIIYDASSMLEELFIYSNKLSVRAAIKLFTGLTENKKLRVLLIGNNYITDEAGDSIVMALQKNTSLVRLWLNHNPISGLCAQCIVQALHNNHTLQQLCLPGYQQDIKDKIRLSVREINEKRQAYECQSKLEIIFW